MEKRGELGGGGELEPSEPEKKNGASAYPTTDSGIQQTSQKNLKVFLG